MNFDLQEKELESYNISVVFFKFGINKISFACVYNAKSYICINNELELANDEKYYIIEHELEHIKANTLYDTNSNEYKVMQDEIKTDDLTVLKNLDFNPEFTKELKSHLQEMEKRVSLNTLNNRVAALCLKQNISMHDLALRLGCSEYKAQDILNCNCVIEYDILENLSKIFNVSTDYILYR